MSCADTENFLGGGGGGGGGFQIPRRGLTENFKMAKIKNLAIPGRGGGVRTPCPPPLDPPMDVDTCLKVIEWQYLEIHLFICGVVISSVRFRLTYMCIDSYDMFFSLKIGLFSLEITLFILSFAFTPIDSGKSQTAP